MHPSLARRDGSKPWLRSRSRQSISTTLAPSVETARTRGQPAALDAVRAMVAAGLPHALLFVGPSSVGKTTLALDVAAALFCSAEPPWIRPCRECRACRIVETGNHPDLHRIGPEGAGGQIRIGERSNPDPASVRGLISALSLLPVEGGARVAIVEHADRMNEDAQSALLKTLEEPPAGVAIILCADEEELLLPTVRSRCARVRLGPVGTRDIEVILGELAEIDPPTAARLGRLSAGRPGVALSYARNPPAAIGRAEMARTLIDLLGAPRARRLSAIRQVLAQAGEIGASLAAAAVEGGGLRPSTSRGRGRARAVGTAVDGDPPDSDIVDGETSARRLAPAERRQALGVLIDVWRDVARDVRLVQLGERSSVRDPGLLDDLAGVVETVRPAEIVVFLDRLTRAGELLAVANVSPELLADALVLAWPRASGVSDSRALDAAESAS